MTRGFVGPGSGSGAPLARALARLDRLVDLERADRSAGAPGADAIRRVDLEPVRDLLARLGRPERAFRSVHVAGTKGKGSVSALIALGLHRAGLRAGLYTSPHVERVTERVAVAGEPLAGERLARYLERALDAREAAVRAGTPGRDATWFDTLTAAAFAAFAGEGAAWAVVEVGLGGRLDSTNALLPDVCVVTNVDLEHTAILGATRAAIAAEKAGILKPGAAALTGVAPDDAEAGPPLARAAAAAGVPLVHVPQRGRLAERNLALARAALDALGARGVRAADGEPVGGRLLDDAPPTGLPGRLERRRLAGVPVVLDGAHVPSSLRAVLDELAAEPGLGRRPEVVIGMGRDKDAEGLLKALLGRADRVWTTSAGAGPYRSPEELLEAARGIGLEAEAASTPGDAVRRAARRARPDGWVLVTGSLHLVGAVRGQVDPVDEDPEC